MRWRTPAIVLVLLSVAVHAADRAIVFNHNGGWCWYQDERVLVHGDLLILGSVASRSGTSGWRRRGNEKERNDKIPQIL